MPWQQLTYIPRPLLLTANHISVTAHRNTMCPRTLTGATTLRDSLSQLPSPRPTRVLLTRSINSSSSHKHNGLRAILQRLKAM
jgi:hypothetical protein